MGIEWGIVALRGLCSVCSVCSFVQGTNINSLSVVGGINKMYYKFKKIGIKS